MATDLNAAREMMQRERIAGWLTRDYRYTNPVFVAALGCEPQHLTRPTWLWVPADDAAALIVHEVDVGRFPDNAPAITPYANRTQMLAALKDALATAAGGRVAMEYSPNFELPRVARVDAGTVELVQSFGVEVISSADISQYATERWSQQQLDSHLYAMQHVVDAMHSAFEFVGQNVRWKLTEHDVAQFIQGRFDRAGLVTDDGPVVAFNEHSSDPHYEPTAEHSAVIRREGWLLIDAWAKASSMAAAEIESDDDPVYADITWVAKIGAPPSDEHLRVFNAVRRARDGAFDLVRDSLRKGESIQGWQADRVARDSITADGYAPYFVHRLGHSLGKEVHSDAVNLDDWETHDTRAIIPGLGLTIEPGVYLPEFGVRLEMDIHIRDNDAVITGERQDEIVHIQC